MQELRNESRIDRPRLTIRVGYNTLAFAVVDHNAENHLIFEPYTVKSGISIAANLREAFKTSSLLQRDFRRVQVVSDTPVMLVPVEEFNENDTASLYEYAFRRNEADLLLYYVLPDLHAVAVFPVNKDLNMVVNDHFPDIRIMPLMRSVWTHLHRKSFIGAHRKLYVYFREKKMDVFSFDKNRFRFSNTFTAAHSHDAVYFILYVWKILAFDGMNDELHLAGDIPDRSLLKEALLHYIRKTYVINPVADFSRAPVTDIPGLPYDMMTLFVRMEQKQSNV